MKKLALLLVLIPLFTFAQKELNVITFNIRFNNPGDSLDAWPYRKDKAISQVLFHQAQVVGVQEALYGQITDMLSGMPAYRYVGVGRDGGTKGEYSAILYDTTRLQLLNSATFWLSEFPDSVAKKGWDAALPRIVTWAKFTDRLTKKTFFVFNTHFDHMGQVARRESAVLLLKKIAAIAGQTPVVVTGDFNAQPADEPIHVLVDTSNADHLIDTKQVSMQPHYGPEGTFNGFKAKEIIDHPIDHIFIKGDIKVLQHAALSQTWGGRFSSDHFPVFTRLMM